jgi:hypothetical protein
MMRFLADRLVEKTILDETVRWSLKNRTQATVEGEERISTVSSEFVVAM